jgi:hypothetical protein
MVVGRWLERSREKRRVDEAALETGLGKANPPQATKTYIEDRVLQYAVFCENQAWSSRIAYYWLRIPAIVIATIVPALIAANPGSAGRVVATVLGVLVAALTAVEHFLNVGGRWRHYRSLVERLKSETWAYLGNAPPYNKINDSVATATSFIAEVEHIIRTDVGQYISLINTDTDKGTDDRGGSGDKDGTAPRSTTHKT